MFGIREDIFNSDFSDIFVISTEKQTYENNGLKLSIL